MDCTSVRELAYLIDRVADDGWRFEPFSPLELRRLARMAEQLPRRLRVGAMIDAIEAGIKARKPTKRAQ